MAELTPSQNEALDVFQTFVREGYDVFYATYVSLRDGRVDSKERRKIITEAVGMALALMIEVEEAVDAKVKAMDIAQVFIAVHNMVKKAREEGDPSTLFPTEGL